jgi:tetrahydromethanopterin S-methyltransferase subunit E
MKNKIFIVSLTFYFLLIFDIILLFFFTPTHSLGKIILIAFGLFCVFCLIIMTVKMEEEQREKDKAIDK